MYKHLFISADSAVEAIEFANLCLIDKAKQDARTKAFHDCTEMWKTKLLEISVADSNNSEKWEATKELFRF